MVIQSWLKVVGLCAGLLLVGCVENGSGYVDDDVKAEAAGAFARYADAINESDYEVAAAFYDDDADFHWIDRGALQYDSSQAAAASLRGFAQPGMKAVFTLEDPYVGDLSRESVLLSVRYRFDQQTEEGEAVFGFDGWMTVGMVKRDDGWKIAGGQAGPAVD